jgi:hypothetical protein
MKASLFLLKQKRLFQGFSTIRLNNFHCIALPRANKAFLDKSLKKSFFYRKNWQYCLRPVFRNRNQILIRIANLDPDPEGGKSAKKKLSKKIGNKYEN